MNKKQSGVVIDQAACTGCQVCMEICPTDVIRMSESQKAFAAYAEDCQFCFLCVFDCPVDAITMHIERLSILPTWHEVPNK